MSVLKSVRVPEEISEYILSYRGNGFNQKFVNIIRDARDSEEKRLSNLKYIDYRIQERQKILDEIDAAVKQLQLKLRLL